MGYGVENNVAELVVGPKLLPPPKRLSYNPKTSVIIIKIDAVDIFTIGWTLIS
jgi:hypothetical protein